MMDGATLDRAAAANYVIRVQGALDPEWSERLGGMRITTFGRGRHASTVLIGTLADQAALLGALNTLYELGLPVISVQHVPLP
ncbi:MAG: hypothetical protein IT337_13065 [Thermomicrobiales bacterium]|nr:hypothetical protein [Thermomicrobiales bacterium]